jgi:predicted branched-subunit amino acid permease
MGRWQRTACGAAMGRMTVEHGLAEGSEFHHFARGFGAMVPLWFAALPSGLAYGIAAHAAGLSAALTQLFSLLVFSAAGQIGALAVIGSGASPIMAIGTVMLLNVQLVLLGLTIGRRLRPAWPLRLLVTPFLTDGAFAVAAARGPLRLATILGAGLSMYVAWNLGTAAGIVAGQAIADVRRFGSDFTLPLVFLALLVPLLRTRVAVYVASAAGATTLLLEQFAPAGLAIFGAAVVASTVGTLASSRATHGKDGAA